MPTGRFPFLHGYQAINCLATFIQSLRDVRIFHSASILGAYPASVFAQLILIFVLTFFISLITDQVLLIHFLQMSPLTLCVPASLFGIFADRF